MPVYGRGMVTASMIISPQDANAPGLVVRGASLVIQDWPAEGLASEVAPRLDEMISLLHEANRAEHAAIYRRYESELLE
jgi:hypothetical protein